MGQYFVVANLDAKEFLDPYRFGDGRKLREFGCSSRGTMSGLALLLSSNGGRWYGHRIVIAGDSSSRTQWDEIWDSFLDISYDVLAELGDCARVNRKANE